MYLADVIDERSAWCGVEAEGSMRAVGGCVWPKATRSIWVWFSRLAARCTNKLMGWIQCRFVVFNDRLMWTAGRLNDAVRLISRLIIRKEIHMSHGLGRSNRPIRMNCLHILTTCTIQTTRWTRIIHRITYSSWIQTFVKEKFNYQRNFEGTMTFFVRYDNNNWSKSKIKFKELKINLCIYINKIRTKTSLKLTTRSSSSITTLQMNGITFSVSVDIKLVSESINTINAIKYVRCGRRDCVRHSSTIVNPILKYSSFYLNGNRFRAHSIPWHRDMDTVIIYLSNINNSFIWFAFMWMVMTLLTNLKKDSSSSASIVLHAFAFYLFHANFALF